MKKKKIIIISVLLILLINLTGCTKYVKANKKGSIKNPETDQILVQNIICKTENSKKIYEKAYKSNKLNKKQISKINKKINFDKLSTCNNMKIAGKYDGIWTTVFVRPLAWVIIKVSKIVQNYGLSLIIVTLLIRLLVWPFTKKTALQSENMKKAKPALDKLENKYKNKKDQQSQMQKSQEMMLIYKQNGISPLSGCLFSFIQIPLFFAFYEAINRIPALFEKTFLSFQLGTSPLKAVMSGHYQYLIFIILIPASTYFSFKLNSGAAMSKEQEKQMNTMKNIMVIFMTITAFSISSGIAIYWVVSQLVTIIQNLLVKRGKKDGKNK